MFYKKSKTISKLYLSFFFNSSNEDADGPKRYSKTAQDFHPVLPEVGSISDASRAITAPPVRYQLTFYYILKHTLQVGFDTQLLHVLIKSV